MKPFDLKKALSGAKVVTRDGREVLSLTRLPNTNDAMFCLAGVIDGNTVTFLINGALYKGSRSELDLFMAPVKKQVWANVYRYRESKALLVGPLRFSSANAAQITASQEINVVSGVYVRTIMLDEYEE